MRHISRLDFPALFARLRAEDKLALFWFFDMLSKDQRPIVKTRRGDLITTILSYAGLIYVIQHRGQDPVVREFTDRGLLFFKYMRDRVSPSELMAHIPDPPGLNKIRS